MTKMLRLAGHEFIKHLHRPSFILTTLLVPLTGAAILFGISLARGRDDAQAGAGIGLAGLEGTIGYVDHSGLIRVVPNSLAPDLFRAYPDEAAARAAVGASEIDLFYIVPPDYLQTGAVTRYARQLGGSDQEIFQALLRANLLEGDARIAALLEDPLRLKTVRLDAAGNPANERTNANADGGLQFVVPYVFAMLLYMTVFFAASFLLQSVTEEKENRTIEIILTSLQPWQLLGGKVLGLGLLALAQMLLWLGSGRLLLASSGPLGLFQQGFALPWWVWVLAIVYFLLGYLLNASLMAGIGATVTNIREGRQLIALMVLRMLAFRRESPHGTQRVPGGGMKRHGTQRVPGGFSPKAHKLANYVGLCYT